MRKRLGQLVLLLLGVGVAALVGELTLRLALPDPDGYYVHAPHLRRTFEPLTELLPGVEGTSETRVNGIGIRGDELQATHSLRILAVGGSTTQCLYLDQNEAWPGRVQDLLVHHYAAPGRIWVGNAGKVGRRSRENVVQLENLLPQIPAVHTVIVMAGANDVLFRLQDDTEYEQMDLRQPEQRQALLGRSFDRYPREFSFFPPTRLALWSVPERLRVAVNVIRNWNRIEDNRGQNYARRRDRRNSSGPLIDELPDLESALDEFEQNLRLMAETAREYETRIVFLTQPSIYRDDLEPELDRLLWLGARGRDSGGFYSAGALARAFADFNARILQVCEDLAVECIDVDRELPKDTRSFYDGMHFNEAGSERVAQLVFDYLKRSAGVAGSPGLRRAPRAPGPAQAVGDG